jgi:hypothetical protein
VITFKWKWEHYYQHERSRTKDIQIGMEEVKLSFFHRWHNLTYRKITKISENANRANKQIQESFSVQNQHTKINSAFTQSMNDLKRNLRRKFHLQ